MPQGGLLIMAISYKFVDKPRTFDEGADLLEHDIYPLLQKFWAKQGEAYYGKPLNFNAPAFVNLWVLNGLALIVAYENKKPVGLFIGIKYNPMLFEATILQVETVYGETPEVAQGLMDYVGSISSILGIDGMHVQGDMNDGDLCPKDWKPVGSYQVARVQRP